MDFEGLARELLHRIRDILPSWLPGGKLQGQEYVCGSIRGGQGGSFSVNIKTGAWADFADNSFRGGDLISLYAAANNMKQGEAAKILADQYNYQLAPNQRSTTPAPVEDIVVPPDNAPAPVFYHPRHGEPSTTWSYKDKAGKILFHVARYDTGDGKKEVIPYSFSQSRGKFVAKSYPEPRPMYDLDVLDQRYSAPVILVEGEKAAEAAKKIVADAPYVVTTWPNGSQSIKKVNWTSIHGRKVLIWPDADEPGMKAAYSIAATLSAHCEEIKIIDPNGQPQGWDAADALKEGWGWQQFLEWAKPRAKVFQTVTVLPRKETPTVNVEVDAPADTPKSLYSIWSNLGLAMTKSGQPICNVDNCLRVLENWPDFKEVLWFDEFHRKYFSKIGGKTREWTDIDCLNMTAFLQRELGMTKISDDMVDKAARIYAHRHVRNEPREWVESLTWDGEPRIHAFFVDCFGCDATEYVIAASKNWWISMAARLLNPGCKVDTMIILQGPQGARKSTALEIIGGDWQVESKESVLSKDFFMLLQGKLIVTINELDSFGRAENNTIKNIITSRLDRFRMPYSRAMQDFPRQCVFVGTTNEHFILRDDTGARRFWPIKVGHIDLSKIKLWREQCFAEAVHRFKSGEKWYEMPNSAAYEQESRRQADEWESVIDSYCTANMGLLGVTIQEIGDKALNIPVGRLDIMAQRRIGRVLRHLGLEVHNVRVGAAVGRYWRWPEGDRRNPRPSEPSPTPTPSSEIEESDEQLPL